MEVIVREADWIVVGGGSAGAVMAARLSEDCSAQVMLLEAGARLAVRRRTGRAAQHERVAGARPGHLRALPVDGHRVAADLGAGSASPPARAGLGGSSTVNGMIAIRALPDDYDRWAASGCAGWSYGDMLPYLRRMEDDADFGDAAYHGRAGPIPVMRLPQDEWGAVDRALRDGALGLGYGWCDDHNAPVGTVRMGHADDPATVVDPYGRVLGVDGPWVADAWVFPEVPRANTNLPTIAAAERLSDLVRTTPGGQA